ncbi:MAG: PqqD family protein [Desulfobacterales bacterium]|nr:PqqD family protein [Desulfobacterales bacterium]
MLAALRPERSLVVRSHEIADSLHGMARLTGIPADATRRNHSHLNRTPYRVKILDRCEPRFLREKFDEHCGELLETHFPGYTLDDFFDNRPIPPHPVLSPAPGRTYGARGEPGKIEKGEGMETPVRLRANPGVSCREEGPDGALLFNPDTDDLMAINPAGLTIWRALSRPRTREEIAARLLAAHPEAPPVQAAEDVDAFLQSLGPGGFIEEMKPELRTRRNARDIL